jgi:hypothetical protein
MALLRQMLSQRSTLTLGLFLISALHTMIFSIFQVPENFLVGHHSPDLNISCKIVLYTIAIAVSVCNQAICRKIGLRNLLYGGLLANLCGMTTLFINQFLGDKGAVPLVYLNMFFFGLSITSVINSLVTYIVIEYPKKVGVAIVALFAFLNLGALLAPVFLGLFHRLHAGHLFFPFLTLLLLLSLWFVHVYFFDPPFPPHLAHLRKGTLIWKELHYRLGLFVVAIIAYGLTETTFSLWGYIRIAELRGPTVADDTIPLFWASLIIGQIVLLLPLYFFSAKRIFYALVLLIMGAGYYCSLQTGVSHLLLGLIAAGFGCSAVFPILLSMMEKEILSFARGGRLLFYIEMIVSLMLAGYFLGVGVVDIWVQKFGQMALFPVPFHFLLGSVFIGITGIIALFLNFTYKIK